MNLLYFGAKFIVIYCQSIRLHDNDLGQCLGASQPFFQQRGGALRFVMIRQPQISGRGTGQ